LIDKVTELRLAHEHKVGFNAGLTKAQKMLVAALKKASVAWNHASLVAFNKALERAKDKSVGAYAPDDDGYLPVIEVPEPTVWCDVHRQVHMRAHKEYMRANTSVRCGEDDWRTLWIAALED
jgi:hypothetical protein